MRRAVEESPRRAIAIGLAALVLLGTALALGTLLGAVIGHASANDPQSRNARSQARVAADEARLQRATRGAGARIDKLEARKTTLSQQVARWRTRAKRSDRALERAERGGRKDQRERRRER